MNKIESIRFRNIVNISGKPVVPFDGQKKYISTGNFYTDQYEWVSFSSKPSRANLIFEEGQITLAKMKGAEKIQLVTKEMANNIYSTGFFALEAKNIDKKFLVYLMKSPEFIQEKDSYSYGTTQLSIDEDRLKNISLHLVSDIRLQKKIVSILEERTKNIDDLIEIESIQIEKLKLYKQTVITEAVTKGLNNSVTFKNSNIKWIGKMPNHWDTKKGKYVFSYVQRPTRDDDEVITCFRDGDVTLRSNRREDGFTFSEKEIGYQGVDVGDLIVHGMDGFAGAIGISDSKGKASPVLNVLDTDYCKRYYMYYLRYMAYTGVFVALSTGIRVRTCDTSWKKIKELDFPVFPKEEQEKIAAFIDEKLAKTNELIELKIKKIDKLNEYKKSLIYEYVTGKKEVFND